MNVSEHTERIADILWRASGGLIEHKFFDWIPAGLIKPTAQKYNSVEDCLRDLEHLKKTLEKSTNRVEQDIYLTAVSLESDIRFRHLNSPQSFAEHSPSIYGKTVTLVGDYEIKVLQNEMQRCLTELGYRDDWPDNYREWKRDDQCGAETMLQAIDDAAKIGLDCAIQRIAPDLFPRQILTNIPQDKFQFSSSIVRSDEHWFAYCSYSDSKGIEVKLNRNRSFAKSQAFMIALHELFPGHGFEIISRKLLSESGFLDEFYNIQVLGLPRTLLHEGLATYLPIYFIDHANTSERLALFENAWIAAIRHNACYNMLCGRISKENALAILCTEGLMSVEDAKRSVEFCVAWPRYFLSYCMGSKFVRDAISTSKSRTDLWKELYLVNSCLLLNL